MRELFSKKKKTGIDNNQSLSFNPKNEFYQENGYYIFRDLFAKDEINKLQDTVDEVYGSYDESFLRPGNEEKMNYVFKNGLEQNPRSGILKFHTLTEGAGSALAETFKKIFCQEKIFSAFKQFFSTDKFTIHQTILFFTSPLTDLRPDLINLDTSTSGQSFTCWLPLDHIDDVNGGVLISSNPTGNRDDKMINGSNDAEDFIEKYKNNLYSKNPSFTVPILDPGDLLLLAPTTAHGSLPPKYKNRRRSMQVILRVTSAEKWGGFKSFSEKHVTKDEEDEITPHFNILKEPSIVDY